MAGRLRADPFVLERLAVQCNTGLSRRAGRHDITDFEKSILDECRRRFRVYNPDEPLQRIAELIRRRLEEERNPPRPDSLRLSGLSQESRRRTARSTRDGASSTCSAPPPPDNYRTPWVNRLWIVFVPHLGRNRRSILEPWRSSG